MPLIDITYFVRDLAVPQLGNDLLVNDFNSWLAVREVEYLRSAMGKTFADEFIAAISEDEPLQKWLDLRDGKDYTYQGRDYSWKGLLDATTKQSCIADYVYFYYMRDKISQAVGYGGEASGKGENSNSHSATARLANTYNRMVQTTYELWQFLQANSETYSTYKADLVDSCNFEKISTVLH